MNNQESSSRVVGRLAVFSTLAALCALLAEYILISQNMIGYFGFVGFLMLAAVCLWSGFYAFARRYQAAWFDQVTERNKELQLQALFSTLNPWPVLRFDRSGQLISKNSCAKTFFYNGKIDDSTQRSVFDFFPEVTKEVWQDLVFKELPLELEHNRSGYWLCFYFRAHLQLGVINVYGYDVTRYKRLQQQDSQKQNHAAHAAMRTHQLLHDTFRSLHGPAKTLRAVLTQKENAEPSFFEKKLQTHVRNMVDTVYRLEEIAEIEPRHLKLQSHSFDCRFMFEKLMTSAAKKAFENEGELVLDCDFAGYDVVTTDGRRLQQALDALMRFSLLQSKNGVVFVTARWICDLGLSINSALDHSIGFEQDVSKMVLRICVHDSGVLDDKVFNALRSIQEDELTDANGFELSSVDLNIRFLASLAPLVGGQIQCQGSALGGHELILDWPVEISKAQTVKKQELPLADLKVYVFDALQLSSEAVAKTLARAGACVDFGDSRAAMLAHIQASPPDVIIYSEKRGAVLDQALLNEIKNINGHHVAVCVMVHKGENLNSGQFDNLDVESIITKPVRSRLLIQGVEHAFNTVKMAQESRQETPDPEKKQPVLTIDSPVFQSVKPQEAAPSKALLDLMNASQPAPEFQFDNARPCVLVIDDDMVVLHLVSDLLIEMGVDVEVAESAEKGLRLMVRFDFNLVIMDVRMPQMTGFEATQEIRATYGESIPIIALTASNEPADRAKALQIGMNDYLVKPVDRDTFAQRLSRWITLPNLNSMQLAKQMMHNLDEQTPLIQVQDAIRLLSQDTVIFTRSLLRFYGRFGGESKKILALLAEEARDEIIMRLHGLRGGAANIGAYQLRDRVFSVEKVLRQEGITPASEQALHDLFDLLERVLIEATILLKYFMQSDKEQQLGNAVVSIEAGLQNIQGAVDRLAQQVAESQSVQPLAKPSNEL